MRIDFGTEADRTYRIRNCRLIPANRELRQRAKLGQYFDRLSRFGIALDQVKSQRTTVETARKQDKQGVAVTIRSLPTFWISMPKPNAWPRTASASPLAFLGLASVVAGKATTSSSIPVVNSFALSKTAEPVTSPTLEIRGGGGVETGVNAKGETVILTYPLRSESIGAIAFFNEGGGFLDSNHPSGQTVQPF